VGAAGTDRATLGLGSARAPALMIHLDMSFLIRALVPDSGEDRKLREWLLSDEPLGMSGIGWAEFLCGPVEPHDIELARRIVHEPGPFGRPEAELAADLFNRSGRRRGSLSDCMIAASAVRAGGSLAMANPDDFRRFVPVGLRILTAV
jgi:predicted nucleic acid-binding protein